MQKQDDQQFFFNSKVFTIRRILNKPPSSRLDFQYSELLQIFKRLLVFERCLDTDQASMINIFKDMQIQQFSYGKPIFKQGQKVQGIFVVLDGQVRQAGKLLKLGKVVGQIEVIFKEEQYIVDCYCESGVCNLIKISPSVFKENSSANKMISLQSIFHFVQRHEYFQGLNRYNRMLAALVLQTKKFTPGQVVLKEGKKLSKLIFIKRGKVGVRRVVSSPSDSKLIEVQFDQIQQEGVFGEHQVINNIPADVSLVALNHGEYLLASFQFLCGLDMRLGDRVRINARIYPDIQNIIQIFLYKLEEEKQRSKVLQEEGFYKLSKTQLKNRLIIKSSLTKLYRPPPVHVSDEVNKLINDIYKINKEKTRVPLPQLKKGMSQTSQVDMLLANSRRAQSKRKRILKQLS